MYTVHCVVPLHGFLVESRVCLWRGGNVESCFKSYADAILAAMIATGNLRPERLIVSKDGVPVPAPCN